MTAKKGAGLIGADLIDLPTHGECGVGVGAQGDAIVQGAHPMGLGQIDGDDLYEQLLKDRKIELIALHKQERKKARTLD